MTRDPVTATVPGSRTEVLTLLVKHKLTGVPVVHRDGKLVGFVERKHLFSSPEEEQLALLMVKDYPSVDADSPITDLARLMLDLELRHVPVTSGNKLVGIVTPADLMGLVATMGMEKPVEELVRSPCVAVHELTPLNVASEIMRLGKVYALPVLDSSNRLVGILTDRDVFSLSNVNRKVAAHELGLAGDEDEWTWEGLRNVARLYYEEKKIGLPKVPVRDVMVKKPVTVFRITGASEAARLMHRYDFGQLPVVDSRDRPFAMLYELDVVQVLL